MNLAATIDFYAGGPGSGCNPQAGKCGRPSGGAKEPFVKNNKWNPDAKIVYHWTDRDSLVRILDTLTWDAGSVTTNPGYRFGKGMPQADQPRFALVFDLSKLKTDKAPKTVPWEEWELLSKKDVDLMDYEKGAFLGFGARAAKDLQYVRNRVKDVFDEPNFFENHLVPVTRKERE